MDQDDPVRGVVQSERVRDADDVLRSFPAEPVPKHVGEFGQVAVSGISVTRGPAQLGQGAVDSSSLLPRARSILLDPLPIPVDRLLDVFEFVTSSLNGGVDGARLGGQPVDCLFEFGDTLFKPTERATGECFDARGSVQERQREKYEPAWRQRVGVERDPERCQCRAEDCPRGGETGRVRGCSGSGDRPRPIRICRAIEGSDLPGRL